MLLTEVPHKAHGQGVPKLHCGDLIEKRLGVGFLAGVKIRDASVIIKELE